MRHPGNRSSDAETSAPIHAAPPSRARPEDGRGSARRSGAAAAALWVVCVGVGALFAPAGRARAADTPAAPALAGKPGQLPPGQEGRIPFANLRDGILDWRADGERGIWVESPSRQWYYGKFMSSCLGLDFANRVGFDTEPNGDFDKFSYVVVRDGFPERCQLTSLVTSNGPPTARERKAAAAAKANASVKAAGAAPGP
jgi:hypothetical protein